MQRATVFGRIVSVANCSGRLPLSKRRRPVVSSSSLSCNHLSTTFRLTSSSTTPLNAYDGQWYAQKRSPSVPMLDCSEDALLSALKRLCLPHICMQNNDNRVQQIVRNANSFARKFLSLQGIMTYTETLIAQYTELLEQRVITIEANAQEVTDVML